MSEGLITVGGCGRNRTAVDGFAGCWGLLVISRILNKPRKSRHKGMLTARYSVDGYIGIAFDFKQPERKIIG